MCTWPLTNGDLMYRCVVPLQQHILDLCISSKRHSVSIYVVVAPTTISYHYTIHCTISLYDCTIYHATHFYHISCHNIV